MSNPELPRRAAASLTAVTPFHCDTSTPAPGPWRLPNDNERRTQVMFVHPFKDCPSVCELNPDLQEYTDPTMRLIMVAPEMLLLLQHVVSQWDIGQHDAHRVVVVARRILDQMAGKP
jgi:hypothetical protein